MLDSKGLEIEKLIVAFSYKHTGNRISENQEHAPEIAARSVKCNASISRVLRKFLKNRKVEEDARKVFLRSLVLLRLFFACDPIQTAVSAPKMIAAVAEPDFVGGENHYGSPKPISAGKRI